MPSAEENPCEENSSDSATPAMKPYDEQRNKPNILASVTTITTTPLPLPSSEDTHICSRTHHHNPLKPHHQPSQSPVPPVSPLEIESSQEIDHAYFEDFPPGYRFCPFDEELVQEYLRKKVARQPLPKNRIVDVRLYDFNPEVLAEKFKQCGEKEWYFFTPREKKYKNGSRPSRSAGDGYWKATGADRQIKYNGVVVGYRKALVFYTGKAPKGDKTNWIMHEFRVKDPPQRQKSTPDDMTLDEWVLCRIYKKTDKPNARRPRDEEPSHHDDYDATDTMNDHFQGDHQMDYDFNCHSTFNNFMENASYPFDSFDRQSLPYGPNEDDHDQYPAAAAFNASSATARAFAAPLSAIPPHPLLSHNVPAPDFFTENYPNYHNNFRNINLISSYPELGFQYDSTSPTHQDRNIIPVGPNVINPSNNPPPFPHNNLPNIPLNSRPINLPPPPPPPPPQQPGFHQKPSDHPINPPPPRPTPQQPGFHQKPFDH